ncbi:MAG TPA: putative Ig domain-containing protein, partial [Blastocatellia bacterium]
APDGAASDRFGASVAIDADTIVTGAPYHDVGPNTDQGATYVFARSGENWNQRQKLTAQNGAANANFGASVAIDADTIVAGAPNHSESAGNNRGAAYVFAFEDAYWTQKAKLTAPDGAMFDAFGASVAIDAGTAVIGAWGADRGSGAAHVFARSGAKWSRLQRLVADDGAPSVFFGKSVAISGNTMMIGTPRISGGLHQSGLGAAYALVISGNLAQRQKFQIDAANIDPFAHSVAVSGDMAVVGMRRDTVGANTNQGSVYVFARGDGDWIMQQRLTAPDGGVGDFFGHSVAISANTLVVGAPYHNATRGAVYVFTRDGASWGPPLKLTANDGMVWSQFGRSLAIDADTLVIGSPGAERVQGSTYVFARSGVDWIQRQKLTASDGATSDEFGRSAAIDADMIALGAKDAAYLFARSNQNWVQWQKLTAEDGSVYDSFGYSVAISGDTVVVGAPTSDRGSAYVFARNPLPWIDPWSQRQKLTPLDGEPSNLFGISIAISGSIIVIGVMGDDIGQNRSQGSAYVFVRRLEWEQPQKLTVTDGATADLFGSSVALSGDTVMAMKSPLAFPTIDHRRPSALYVFRCNDCPKIEMDQITLPEAVVGDPYDQTFTANGGASPYEFSLSSGSLPPGLELLKSGLLSGYPLIAGAYNFTITATDSNHCPGSINYTLIVRSPCSAITIKTDLSEGAVGQPYSRKFGATGGTAPYSFKISKGAAPPGLKLSAEGEIYGVPTNAGAFKFTVTASDANGCAGSRDYTLTINK